MEEELAVLRAATQARHAADVEEHAASTECRHALAHAAAHERQHGWQWGGSVGLPWGVPDAVRSLPRPVAPTRQYGGDERAAPGVDEAVSMLNTMLEDLEQELMALTAISSGQAGPGGCPPQVSYAIARAVQRIKTLAADRVDGVMYALERSQPASLRTMGPGVEQMDACLGR